MRQPRNIAIIITLLLAVVMLMLLLFCRLNLTLPADRTWPPENHGEISMMELDEETFVDVLSDAGDELNEVDEGDEYAASAEDSDEPTQISHDLATAAPEQGVNTVVTASEAEAPVKVKNPDKSGAAKAAEEAARAEAERQQQAKKNIENRLNDRFSGAGKGSGKSSTTEGAHASKGSGGGAGLGMTASADVRPRSGKLGTVVINVTVLPDGTVRPGSASINLNRCSGDAGTDTSLRDNCLKAAYKCRFARQVGETTNVPGTITFKWE